MRLPIHGQKKGYESDVSLYYLRFRTDKSSKSIIKRKYQIGFSDRSVTQSRILDLILIFAGVIDPTEFANDNFIYIQRLEFRRPYSYQRKKNIFLHVLNLFKEMPWWSGAVENDILEVEDKYVSLSVKLYNGQALNDWTHHSVDIENNPDYVNQTWWETDPSFTFFLFCPFNTTLGGYKTGEGRMRFQDFYSGKCSDDGRLCTFLSRPGTRIWRKLKPESAKYKGKLMF